MSNTTPPPVQVNLTPLNMTAELQKVALSNTLTKDQHADLRTLILDAAAAIGMDGSGRDGLLGYLKFAASTYPKQYLQVISKVLPLQVDSHSTVNVIEHVNIVSVPPDRYMPPSAFGAPEQFVGQDTVDVNSVDITDLDPHSPTDSPIQKDESVQTIEDLLKNPTPVDLPVDKAS
jgi:hypothetical protein